MSPLPGLAPGTSVAAARQALARAFRAAAIESPELDARVLLQAALALDHAALAVVGGRALTPAEAERIAVAAARRLQREPVARIVGCKEFWGLPLAVTPATLVPRPETETVVEAALAALGAEARTQPLRIADLGTGTGALVLALAHEWPQAFAVGTDRSLGALATAAHNARALGLAARTAFIACDFGAALAGGLDLVVANPPYVETGALAGLPPEVRDHDPRLALDGGADGLCAYRAIAADAGRLLRPGGHLVVELGAGQAAAVAGLLAQAKLAPQPPIADLAGIPRALWARR